MREILGGIESIGIERFYVQALFGPEIPAIEETFALIGAYIVPSGCRFVFVARLGNK